MASSTPPLRRPARANRRTCCGAWRRPASADRRPAALRTASRRTPKPAPAAGQHHAGESRGHRYMSRSTAEEAVWVLARADGKYAFSATLDPNTTRTVEGDENDAAAGQCGRGDDFAERQADRSGGTEGAGADDSVHLGRLPDCAGQGASAWTRSIVSDGAALRWRLRSRVSNSRRRRSLMLSSTLCQNLREVAHRRNQREEHHAPHQSRPMRPQLADAARWAA